MPRRSSLEYFLFSGILFYFILFFPSRVLAQTIPLRHLPCFNDFKFRFLGGNLNYSGSQEKIERLLGVWGVGCSFWKKRFTVGIDFQFGQLLVEHHSPAFNTTLNLIEVSSRIWAEGKVFEKKRVSISLGAAFETLLSSRQKMGTAYLDVVFGGDNRFELTALAAPMHGENPQISLFGFFTILEIVSILRIQAIPHRLDVILRTGYRRYALDIDNEVGPQVETLLAFSNHRSDEFKKNIIFHAAEITPGLKLWIIPGRFSFVVEAMVLPLPLEADIVSLFYGGNSAVTLSW